ncbi:MAG: LysR family transcriptional regulator [Atopobiaceae bacterium]
MDSSQIDQFLAVFEAKSMHAAAEKLYMSEPGLGRSIRKLEHELGCTLFERRRTGIYPTPEGHYFYGYAIDAKRRYEQVQEGIQAASRKRRELALPCAAGALHIIFPLIAEFEETHPDVHIAWRDLSDIEAEREVLAGHADIGILVRNWEARGLDFAPLCQSRQVLLAPEDDPLSKRDAIRYSDLKGSKVACEGADYFVNRQLTGRCLEEDFIPDIVETKDISLCFQFAQAHEMLSIVPACIAQRWPLAGVAAIPFADERYVWEIGVSWVANRKPEGDAYELADFLYQNRDRLSKETSES